MEANDFVSKLKANGTENDQPDLDKVYEDYKVISNNLPTKDQGQLSLNVLCILCRNLDKVPTWGSSINVKSLLTLSIDCVRYTRGLGKPDRVKTLACIYHIHKYSTKQNNPTPELVLKLSYMAFENNYENLLHEYVKTYWNILADRFAFMENIKTQKCPIIKLLPKLIDDVLKIIKMYDSVQFSSTILVFCIKKLNVLFSEYALDVNRSFCQIFECLSTKEDLKNFKKLSESEILNVYGKFNECFYAIAENSSKMHFKESVLTNAFRTVVGIVGHCPDLFHCLKTFHLNSICTILSDQVNLTFNETILMDVVNSCQTTEKLGYKKAMYATYPYLSQFLKIYIEYYVANCEKKKWKNNFNAAIQINCLNLIIFLTMKLKNCNQLLKCDNCTVKSGLHDALRLSFLAKNLITISLAQDIDITTLLTTYWTVVTEQYNILATLCKFGCSNYLKCYKKQQADVHNVAISLNKSKYYEASIKLFNIYLTIEIKHFKDESDLKNISRGLYNKSICLMDTEAYEKALKDAYLSLIFSYPESMNADKYMSLAMDIKSKVLKSKEANNDDDDDCLEDDENQDDVQLTTSFDICLGSLEDDDYGILKPFFSDIKFSCLLKHEFKMYVKLWPSIVPIAGVWKSLHTLLESKQSWITAKDEDLLRTLYEVVIETPTAVRSIQSDYFSKIVHQLVDDMAEESAHTAEMKIIHATLLFLKTEYNMAEASLKYGWKVTEPNLDPDRIQSTRLISQEHEAMQPATRGLSMLTDAVRQLHTVPTTPLLSHALLTAQAMSAQLLHLSLASQGLQSAHLCCQMALRCGDAQAYIQNAGTIIHHARQRCRIVDEILSKSIKHYTETLRGGAVEVAIVFSCQCAVYYTRCGHKGFAAKLIQSVQARVLKISTENPETNLELAIGYLLEAQYVLCGAENALSTTTLIQRHYLSVWNHATKHTDRRLRSLTIRIRTASASLSATLVGRHLQIWRRALAAAGCGIGAASGTGRGRLYAAVVNTRAGEDAQVKIDNRLKYILGLQSSTEILSPTTASKVEPFTPKQGIETMLENFTFKKVSTSPTVPCLSVPGFKPPPHLDHKATCQCCICQNPDSQILICQTLGLESATYFRAKEAAIARNYFEGTFRCFSATEAKLKGLMKGYKSRFEKYLVNIVEKEVLDELKQVLIEVLVEASFFEMSLGNFKVADEYIVRIHELLAELEEVDSYLNKEVLYLNIAAAKMKEHKKVVNSLEVELESLKLSPDKDTLQKTPDRKPMRPEVSKVVVKDEEMPHAKRRVIKLNLDDNDAEEKETKPKTRPKRGVFKIPVPVVTKPRIETVTPRKPTVVLTQPSTEESPKPKPIQIPETPIPDTSKLEFFTPMQTPSEQFFTPMDVLKTYGKKSLRQNIVKKLESEFGTPVKKAEAIVKNAEVVVKNAEALVKKSEAVVKKTEGVETNVTGKEAKGKPRKSELEPSIPEVSTKAKPKSKSVKKEAEKENVLVKSKETKTDKVEAGLATRDKRRLKRATSPGKLGEEKPVRSSRLRKPVKIGTSQD